MKKTDKTVMPAIERWFAKHMPDNSADRALAKMHRPSEAELLDDNHAHADKVLEEISNQEAEIAGKRIGARLAALAEHEEYIRLAIADGWSAMACQLIWN